MNDQVGRAVKLDERSRFTHGTDGVARFDNEGKIGLLEKPVVFAVIESIGFLVCPTSIAIDSMKGYAT